MPVAGGRHARQQACQVPLPQAKATGAAARRHVHEEVLDASQGATHRVRGKRPGLLAYLGCEGVGTHGGMHEGREGQNEHTFPLNAAAFTALPPELKGLEGTCAVAHVQLVERQVAA